MGKNIYKNPEKGIKLALLAVLFWSTISSAFKITLRFIAFDQMLFWTVTFSVFFLWIINKEGNAPISWKNIKLKYFLMSALMGFLNPFLYYLILFKAYDLLEAQIAGALNYTWPIVLVLLSIPLLNQKISWKSILAITISFMGILFISTKGTFSFGNVVNPVGVILAVGSAVFWALYWILNMKDSREDSGKILLNLIFGWVYIFIYFIFSGRNLWFYSWQGWAGSAYIGMFEMSLTYVIWLKALDTSTNVAQVSNLIYLSPFLGLFWIYLTVGESIHLYTIVGLVLIVLGILLQQFVKQLNYKSNE